ncbi:hypothetical protein PsYK624_061720 [Phanerochaete sordida]|uniref:F-box domain-containing protein n=1 Tax=Phanerochaete sordida TaxID=48140 RepID=A0A9P3G9W6_9APHY|nr:hypothetical protein PsYK624_061720 [Phanerochaete sordida]
MPSRRGRYATLVFCSSYNEPSKDLISSHIQMSDLVPSLAQTDGLLKTIDDEIETLQRKARGVRSHRNTLVPINRLPLEILAEIFYEVVGLHESTTRPSRTLSYYPMGCGTPRWLVVTFVCRAWRSLALGTSRLWSHMLFNENAERIELFLARSSTAPLMVTVWHAEGVTVVKTLFGVMHRVQELKLSETMLRAVPMLAEDRPHGSDSHALRTLTVGSTVPFPTATLVPTVAAATWPVISNLALNGGHSSLLHALVRPTLTSLSAAIISLWWTTSNTS